MFAPKQRSSPKKKPFVSTAKRNTTFGTPPPLPPLTPKERDSKAFQEDFDFPEVDHSHDEEGAPGNHLINLSRFQEMSIRWTNMSTALWFMIVGNSSRRIARESLQNFITALYWRLNGAISEEEFHCLYQEWNNKRASCHKSVTCDVFVLRDCLLEQSTSEGDLEIFLGIIIFETNKGFINSPLSYHSTRSELCSTRWLSLSEELYFLLDTSGQGYLGFDDLLFLSLSLLSSSHTWKSETELDAQMSLTNVTAVTVQLMREAGSEISLDSTTTFPPRGELISPEIKGIKTLPRKHTVTYDGNGHRVLPESPFGPVEVLPQPFIQSPPAAVGIITLPMFKRLLIQRSVGEISLVALIAHIKECIQRLIMISEEKSVRVLYSACVHDDAISAPKLWKTCIESIFGSPPANELPPILLHLLTDACFRLPLSYIAFPSDGSDAVWTFLDDLGFKVPQDFLDQDKHMLDAATFSIWSSFHSWGEEVNPDYPMNSRDSVYQLISCVASEYKSSLHLLCAAFIDIAIETYDIRLNFPSKSSSGLLTAITSLLPERSVCDELLQAFFKAFSCTTQDQSHNPISDGEIEVKSHTVPEIDEHLHQFEESNRSDWQANLLEEISNAIWATVFDMKDVQYSFIRSPPPGQSSPNGTINFVERRRKRRTQRKFHDSPQSLRTEKGRLEFDGSRDKDAEDKSTVKLFVFE